MTDPRPLFVLGKHRSGTTWLANQLCEHPDIVGVQHPAHYGIHESAYFERVVGRFGDLSVRTNYIEFVRVMASSDYFRLVGADEELLFRLWPSSYEQVFEHVMRRFALRSGARWWLEKSPGHTPLVARLHETYPHARFIGIVRDPVDVVSSVISRSEALSGRRADAITRARRVARVVASWAHYNRAMAEFAEDHSASITIVRYERLRADNHDVLRMLCESLGIDFSSEMTAERWVRDTTIASNRHRQRVLTPRERRFAAGLAEALSAIPQGSFELADRAARLFLGRRDLPTWFFRLLESAPPETGAAPVVPVIEDHAGTADEVLV